MGNILRAMLQVQSECLDPWDYLALSLDVITSPCLQDRNIVVLGRMSVSAQTFETSESVSTDHQVRQVSQQVL